MLRIDGGTGLLHSSDSNIDHNMGCEPLVIRSPYLARHLFLLQSYYGRRQKAVASGGDDTDEEGQAINMV